ncbi:MAG: hypothetical protein NTV29_00940 [Planctomycetota bacterium]|jgi:hypothetical protein|nr:hypothetical protein [Planctomycetota bacterium]
MIRLIGLQPTYMPGDSLEFEYRVANVDRGSIVAVECSVCWITEGKGTEDLGVHFFQRLAGDSLAAIDWSIAQKISCPLPVSPLSYEGKLLKISWCVRARFFLGDGTELMAQQPFYLGTITREI